MNGEELYKYLKQYSLGEITALELRKRMGGATFGDVLIALGEANLPLPRASQKGREESISRARNWLFPESHA